MSEEVKIEIKTSADLKGVQDASAALAGMSAAATPAAAEVNSIAASTGKVAEAAAAAGPKLTKVFTDGSREAKTLGLVTAASTGNIGAMARAMGALSAAMGSVMMVAAALFAAIKAGLAIQKWLWANFVDNIKGVEPVVFKTREEFDELNKVKLDTLKDEVSTIRKEAEAVMSTIDRAVARAAALRNAEAAAEKARIMAEEPDGPERDLKLAALEKTTADADIAARETAARQKDAELAKQEAAIRARLAEAEKADQSVQEMAAKTKERYEASPSGSKAKAANQARYQAQSSAASLAALRGELDSQLTSIGEGRADATNELAITAAQRSAAGSQFTGAQQSTQRQAEEDRRKATARQTREALQAQIAAKQAEAENLPKTMPMDNLNEAAAAEQADVTRADQAIDQFKSTSRMSTRSHGYQSELRDLESIRQKEQAEADQAVATARETAQALGQALRSITTEIANLKSQMANLEN